MRITCKPEAHVEEPPVLLTIRLIMSDSYSVFIGPRSGAGYGAHDVHATVGSAEARGHGGISNGESSALVSARSLRQYWSIDQRKPIEMTKSGGRYPWSREVADGLGNGEHASKVISGSKGEVLTGEMSEST